MFWLATALLGAATAGAQPVAVPGTAPTSATPSETTSATPPATPAAAPADGGQRIEITGNRESDTAQRRQSTAAKIIIGRDEIDKFGDSSVGEVLRRLPGVTTPGAPGRGGPPRLRGLGNGYTQLLIDGQRVPPGFSLESLTPDQIERIEILRAPTAETGARAIAGTINIVLREGARRRSNEVRVGAGLENGVGSPNTGWTHNDSAGALSYNLSASVFSTHRKSAGVTETTDSDTATGTRTGEQRETAQTQERRQGINLGSRLQWRLGDGGDMLALSPTLFHTEAHSDRAAVLVQSLPAPPALPLYDQALSATASRYTNGRLGLQWRQRLAGGLRADLNGGLGVWRAFNDTVRNEVRNGGTLALRTLQDSATTREHAANLTAKLSQLLGGSEAEPETAHSLVAGTEAEAVRRKETRVNSQIDSDGDGDNLQASSLRLAAYAQDEWSLSPHWSAHAGLRWEGITTRGAAAGGARPSNRSSVTTPLLHAVWKPDPKGRDQLRLSLTRSYRAPGLGTLIAQPSINNKYPVGTANTPTSSDRAGNPDLKPELATGIDIAAERYLASGGLLSANVFHRSISNLMRSVTTLETVAYSPVQRYVARQQNIGDAVTKGLELEAKFALDQAISDAPRIELRGNLGLFRSRVDGVPGPDNRLDQQAKASANVGADYRFRGDALKALTLGGNINWVPGYETQLSNSQRTRSGGKRVFDSYALWTFSPAVALRLLASNLAPREYDSSNTIVAGSLSETALSSGPSYTNWQLRLELKL